MSIGSKFLLACGVVAGCAFAFSAARAAPEPFCRDYTRAALAQVQKALAIPRCRRGMDGPRWSADYKVHFGWCLGASLRAADEERAARTVHLRRCE